jgi:hypothetical protein
VDRLFRTDAAFFAFHIEHIRARQHRAGDDIQDLAMARPACNAYTGPNRVAIDPKARECVRLFNPRTDRLE